MKPKPLDVLKVKYGELFRYLAEQEQAMTSAEQLFLMQGDAIEGIPGMHIFYSDPEAYFKDEWELLRPAHLDIRKVKYGELFRILAEHEQVLTSAKQIFLIQGEVFPDLHGMLIFYTEPYISSM